MAGQRSDLMLGLGIDASGALKEAQRLADKMRQELGGAGAGGARSADEIAQALKRATDAASSTGRAMGGIGPGGTAAAARSTDDLADALRRTDVDATRARGSLDDLTGSAKELAIVLAAGIGAALAGGALAGWIGQAADAADEVARLADQTGISAEKLSAWGNVAQRNGQDLNDLAELTTEMSLRLSEIDKDSEGAGLALKNLGLDYKALAAMPAEQAFEAIARSVAGTENSGRKTALVMAALGDEAQKYITTLNTIGAAGQMEAIVTAQQAAAAREYKDALNGVSAAGAAWSQSIVAGILPALSEAARALDDVMSGTNGMTAEARKLAQDGSITDWARAGVIALTYLADAGSVVVRAFKIVGHTIAADAAIAGEAFSALGSAAKLALSGDFAAAAETVRGGMARVKSISADASATLDGMWSEKTLGAKIRDRMEQTKAYTAAAQTAAKVNVSGRSMVKQEAPKSGGQSVDGSAALAKAQAQAALTAEIDATNAIRKELERRHSLGLAASGDYYQQLADLAERESKAKLAAIDAEAAAEKARATKDPASATQSEARLVEIATKRAQEVAAAREKAADIGAQADREALDESRRIAQEWAQSWQAADKMAQQYAGASAKAQAAMIVDPLERARAEASIAAQQISDDGAQMMLDLGNQIDGLSGAGLSAQADALRVKLDQIREGIKAEQARTIAAPDVAMVADYLGKESPGQRIAEGFDAASQSLSAFVTGFQSLFKVEENYGKALSARGLTSQQIADIEAKHSADQINAYGTLAGAAKGFFKQGSSGYKALQTAEKAFRAYELAMSVKTAAVKMGLFSTTAAAKVAAVATETGAVIAGQGVETGAVTAGEAVRNAAKVPGVFMSYLSALGPWGMAAAGAAVAAVLGGGFGSKGGAAPTSADRQASQGTGTVLGDDSAKSQSVTKSLDRLRDVNTLTMQYSAQMLASLRGIEAAMAGVSTQILRAGGVTTGKNLGIETGKSGAGDAVGSLLSKIPLIGGVLGGVVGGIFGKSSSTITDAGLSISGTAAQMQQGQGVNQYADKTTTKKSWFGSSTKTSTILQDAGADVSRQFGLIFGGVSDSLQSAAGAMGQDAAAVAQRLAGYVIDIPRLSLQGLKGDDLQEAISTAVGAKADEMARLVAPGLVDFQRIGEGYFETVVRVASATESAGETLRRLGVASVSLGQVVSKGAEDIGAEIVRQSITALEGASVGIGSVIDLMAGSAQELADTYKALRDVRDSLVMMGVSGAAVSRAMLTGAGSLEQLASGVTAFEEGFFSESERTQMATARMAAEFKRLGVAMPSSRAGFRSLVTGIDTSTEAGQQLLGSLLPLSSQFGSLMDQMGELGGVTGELGKSVEDEIARIRGVIGQRDGQSVAGAQAAFTVATAAARAGDTKALESLPGLSQALLKSAEEQAVTRADLVRLQAQTAASLQTTLDTVRDTPVSVIAAPVTGVPGVIAPAAQTGATAAPAAPATPAGGGNSALLIELQALRTESAAMRAELQAMRAESASGLTTIATNTGRSARILDRVTAGGDTIQTEAVA